MILLWDIYPLNCSSSSWYSEGVVFVYSVVLTLKHLFDVLSSWWGEDVCISTSQMHLFFFRETSLAAIVRYNSPHFCLWDLMFPFYAKTSVFPNAYYTLHSTAVLAISRLLSVWHSPWLPSQVLQVCFVLLKKYILHVTVHDVQNLR